MILFLDSSALIKNYVREAGTGAMQTKLRATETAVSVVPTTLISPRVKTSIESSS